MKMFTRAGRAAIFDRKVFTEAFFDDDAMADSAIVVAVVAGVGYLATLALANVWGLFDVAGLFAVLIFSVASWLILGFASWLAATKIFGSSARYQTLIAMQGLAVLPLLLDVFGPPLSWIGLLWYLAVLVVATKEASDLDYKLAGVSVLIGFAAVFLVRLLLGAPFALFSGVLA